MNLLTEIIDSLSSLDGSLTEALLKTKVLLHKIGHKELAEWVSNELNGYADKDNLPEYRILTAQVLVNAANMAYQFNAHPIPLGHLTKEQRESLETARMYQSLAVLEKFSEGKGGHLEAPIPMEANNFLGKQLAGGVMIQRAWCQISKSDVTQILIQVRSRLLDFVLGLQDELGEELTDQELKERTDRIDASSLFNNAIFGDNTTIVVGSHNEQTVSNVSIHGDFNALAEELRKHNVNEDDIFSLETAIDSDCVAPELAQKRFGPAVKSWLQRMLAKAVDASWQIELGVASSLLATALQKYYGWP